MGRGSKTLGNVPSATSCCQRPLLPAAIESALKCQVSFPVWVQEERFGIALSLKTERLDLDHVVTDIAALANTIRPALLRKVTEDRIRFLAHHDDLTQLPNRLMFQQRISEAVDAVGTNKSCALLYLDLDRFKQVNDTRGHAVDDKLLTAAAHCMSPRRLDLEVAEGLLLDDAGLVLDTMNALRAQGVGMTLDDFGTAHASLSYLRRFPFDRIKIDRSLIKNITDDNETLAIVQTILPLSKRLKLSVVAEGVEEQEQLDILRGLGCTLVQGYLTGRPVPPEQMPTQAAQQVG